MEYARIERKELNDLVKKYNSMLQALRRIETMDDPKRNIVRCIIKRVLKQERILLLKDLNIQLEEQCAFCKQEFYINNLYRFTNEFGASFICGKCQEREKVPTLR